jgi:Tol biopolymer transport system component
MTTAKPAGDGRLSVVLNYRREDTAGHAGRLYDALARRFGEECVFMDIDAIEPGADFTQAIERAVESCHAFIALIGRRWLTVTDATGRKRLENPDDFVRLELEAALQRAIRVIPVLVQNADMPSSDQLPSSLTPLSRRHALEIRDSSWQYDVDRLVEALEDVEREAFGPGEPRPRPRETPAERSRLRLPSLSRKAIAALVAAAALVAGAIVAIVALRGGEGSGGGGEAIGTPQGERLAFESGGRIGIVTENGSEADVDVGGFAEAPDWSPDGSKVAFSRGGDIWVVPVDGGAGMKLTDTADQDNGPDWSPDEDAGLIAFGRRGSGIWVVPAAGGTATQLTPPPTASGAAPDWSPDGRQVAFQRDLAIWIMDEQGADQRALTADLPGRELFPSWSPDGRRIAYVRVDRSACELGVINLDSGNVTPLPLDEPAHCRDPIWSPDARRIFFVARRSEEDDGIWAVNRDGTELTRVLEGSGFANLTWIPAA